MRLLGLMRVRNEGRWLERCLKAQEFCERIIVLDDNSTDDTAAICRRFPQVDYRRKPVEQGYAEGPDREWLAREARAYSPDWICSMDGPPFARAGVQLLHYGYMTDADRLRHLQRETSLGRDGSILVQGDPGGPPASANLSGEPLRVEPLDRMRAY